MPELPEVETIRRQLHNILVGRTIKNIQVLKDKSFHGDPNHIIGNTIKSIDRQAKVIIINFKQRPFPKVLTHLRMTGQLIYQPTKGQRVVGGHPTPDWVEALPRNHTRAILTLDDDSTLYFNDQRIFGWLKVTHTQEDLDNQLKNFTGIEPLKPEFTPQEFTQRMLKTSRPIKVAILDQKLIAGVGNIYANDALWDAQIHPEKQANTLTKKEYMALHQSIEKVIGLGIKYGGATESDYRHLDGLGGSYQNYFLTYKMDGIPCQRCGTPIQKIKVGGRGTYFCPNCQK